MQCEAGYQIYRGSSPGSLELVGSVSAGKTTFKDVGVSGGLWYYQIIAYNATGSSIGSNIQSVEVYSAGGGIPGFEGLFVLLAVVVIIAIFRRMKPKTTQTFLNLVKN